MTSQQGAPGRRRAAAGLRLAVTLGTLVAGEVVLWRAGSALPSFPLDGAGALRTFDEAEPLSVAVGLLRLVALGAGGGLLLAATLGLLARACGGGWLVVHLDRWTPAGVRRLLDRALGVGLAASIGLSVVPAAADPGGAPPPPTATLRRLPDAPTTTLRRLPDGPASPPAPGPATTLRRLPDAVPLAPSPPAPPPEAPAASPSNGPSRHEVVVRPGDSFWLLAERHEAERLGRRPTEAEVGACWQELVAVNRHRLAVPDDPDLLFPGQTLIVPCP